MTDAQIAACMGISQERVEELRQRAERMLEG
jgi:DNA-binding CsgD family transcriptional regulator